MTNREILLRVQQLLLEPGGDSSTWPSGLWTLNEALMALQLRQQHFLSETGVLVGWREQALVPLQEEQIPPADAIQDVWYGLVERNGVCFTLQPTERAQMDRLLASWRQAPGWPPLVFSWEEAGSGRLTVAPAPLTSGTLHLFGPALAENVWPEGLGGPVTYPMTEVELTLPEEWAPWLVFGVLAALLGKHGRGYDGPRAAYCEARYQEGIQGAQALVRGWAG